MVFQNHEHSLACSVVCVWRKLMWLIKSFSAANSQDTSDDESDDDDYQPADNEEWKKVNLIAIGF